jgi:hypothetical protein
MSAEAKTLNLGLMLLNLVGEETLAEAVDALGGSVRSAKRLSVDTLSLLLSRDPADLVSQLPVLIEVLIDKPVERATEALAKAKALKLPDDDLVPIMAQIYVRHYGERIVNAALLSIEPRPTPAPAPAPAPPQPGI